MIQLFYVTQTPTCYKISFPNHPQLAGMVRMIPSVKQDVKAAYIPEEKAWKVALADSWYVHAMSKWAVANRIVQSIQYRQTQKTEDFAIPALPKLTVPHGHCSISGASSETSRDLEKPYRPLVQSP